MKITKQYLIFIAMIANYLIKDTFGCVANSYKWASRKMYPTPKYLSKYFKKIRYTKANFKLLDEIDMKVPL